MLLNWQNIVNTALFTTTYLLGTTNNRVQEVGGRVIIFSLSMMMTVNANPTTINPIMLNLTEANSKKILLYLSEKQEEDGNFIVVWQNEGNTVYNPTAGTYGQIYSMPSTKVGTEFTIARGLLQGNKVIGLSNGNFVVTWYDKTLTDGFPHGEEGTLYGQGYTNAGSKIDSKFNINSFSDRRQNNPSMSALTNGDFMVVWAIYDQDDRGIYGKLFKAFKEFKEIPDLWRSLPNNILITH